jgi:hypothetical protein
VHKTSSLLFAYVALLLLLIAPRSCAFAADWSACASDLDDVHQASDDASTAANEANEAEEDLESKRSDLDSCSGDCESERDDYESAKEDFDDKKDSARGELDTLDLKIRDASASCGYDLGAPVAASQHRSQLAPPDRCSISQRYKGRLKIETILKVCKGSMSEAECKKCLGIGTK